ncbi:hypothetical protein LCGC14_0890630 [marine sediment metagenome]|uniref:Portal protein n=1 Tax=marine sediment metagenome TaxID=412755 RepID=A0A0F9RIP7_9ZZZZ
MATYLDKVKEQRTRKSALHARMDADKNLLYLVKYVMMGRDEHSPVPNIRNSTMNDPAVFFANITSNLGSAVEQRVVETDDDKLDTTSIEDFLESAFGAVGLRRAERGEPQINPFFDEQSCIRGRVGARCLFQMIDGVLDTDITPWDMRFVTYSPGKKGLDWGANTTWRTKEEIEAEAWVKDSMGLTAALKGKGEEIDIEVLDVWDTVHNEIWVNNIKVFEQPHSFGFTPVAIQTVTLGSMLADKDALAHKGESIFFLFRDLVDELNELASIAKTINFRTVEGALQEATEEGRSASPGEDGTYEKVTRPGSITTVDKGGGYANMPIQDVMRAFGQLMGVVESRIQRGSLSSIDLGIMPGQPPSAIALIQISEGRDQVFLPRLGVRGLLNQQLSHMIINQVKQIGGTVELGARGHKKSFNVSQLEGEYDITFKYFIKDTKVDAARYSVAAAAGNLISEKTKRRDIMQLEDPEGEEQQLRIEEAELLFPVIKQTRVIRALAESDDDDQVFEAEMASLSMGISLDRLMAGEAPELPPAPEQRPQPLELGIGGGTTSAQKASDLQRTPVSEEGG